MTKYRNPYAAQAWNRKGGSHTPSKKEEYSCKTCKGKGQVLLAFSKITVPCWNCEGEDKEV